MPQIDVDHLVSVLHPRAEVIDVFLHIDCGSLRQCPAVIVFLIDLLRRDVDIIFIIFSIQDDVERKIVYVIPFFQLAVKITGAVRA